MSICPNLSNKKIKSEFDSLVNAVGEKMAYYLWNKHEGNYSQISQEVWGIDQDQHYYNALYDASDSVYTLSDDVIENLTTYPAEGDYTAKDFMQRMLTSGELFNDPVQQSIALNLFEKGLEGATVVFSNDSNYWMKYHNGVITVSLSAFGLNPYEFGHKFMHEVTHHYTETECEKGGALYDIIKQLRENIEQHVSEEEKKDRLFYGLTDNHEFPSEI